MSQDTFWQTGVLCWEGFGSQGMKKDGQGFCEDSLIWAEFLRQGLRLPGQLPLDDLNQGKWATED